MFEMRGEASAYIEAPPKQVYEVVSDITRMGDWSPECVGGSWIPDASGPVVGAQFHGDNRRGPNEWTTPNTVIAADEGREFAWVVGTPEFRVCTWRYELNPEGAGTRVTESFELGREPVGFSSMVDQAPEDEREQLVAARRHQLVQDMQHTLARIKEAIESS
jgi:hypothetical protein